MAKSPKIATSKRGAQTGKPQEGQNQVGAREKASTVPPATPPAASRTASQTEGGDELDRIAELVVKKLRGDEKPPETAESAAPPAETGHEEPPIVGPSESVLVSPGDGDKQPADEGEHLAPALDAAADGPGTGSDAQAHAHDEAGTESAGTDLTLKDQLQQATEELEAANRLNEGLRRKLDETSGEAIKAIEQATTAETQVAELTAQLESLQTLPEPSQIKLEDLVQGESMLLQRLSDLLANTSDPPSFKRLHAELDDQFEINQSALAKIRSLEDQLTSGQIEHDEQFRQANVQIETLARRNGELKDSVDTLQEANQRLRKTAGLKPIAEEAVIVGQAPDAPPAASQAAAKTEDPTTVGPQEAVTAGPGDGDEHPTPSATPAAPVQPKSWLDRKAEQLGIKGGN